MALMGATCALLLTLTTLIHYEALHCLSSTLPRLRLPLRTKLIVVIIGSLVAHIAEVACYAMAIYALVRWFDVGSLGSLPVPSLEMSLYFSAETYSSLGYGDIVPHGPLRMLAGIEALNGLLLIGWSASYV